MTGGAWGSRGGTGFERVKLGREGEGPPGESGWNGSGRRCGDPRARRRDEAVQKVRLGGKFEREGGGMADGTVGLRGDRAWCPPPRAKEAAQLGSISCSQFSSPGLQL